MNATVHTLSGSSRRPPERDPRTIAQPSARSARAPFPPARAMEGAQPWLVDLAALARCRSIFAGHADVLREATPSPRQLSTMDVPVAYDAFCRAHFGTVRRSHPALAWDDACPAYAIALSAHAGLCVALEQPYEARLQQHWSRIRGDSTLTWEQARPLIADGCSALNRIDPLAMQR